MRFSFSFVAESMRQNDAIGGRNFHKIDHQGKRAITPVKNYWKFFLKKRFKFSQTYHNGFKKK